MEKTAVEKGLETLAKIQVKHYLKIFIILCVITLFLLAGIPKIKLETDMMKLLPKEIEGVAVQLKIRSIFGGEEPLFIVASIDKECSAENMPKSILEPEVLKSIKELQNAFEKEPNVKSVFSIAMLFPQNIPEDENMINEIIKSSGMDKYVTKDKTSTLVIINADLGNEESVMKRSLKRVREIINNVQKPTCVKYSLTGTIPLRVVILDLMLHDVFFTFSIALVIIFLLLIILRRSVFQSIIVLTPLITGIIWALGIFGWINLKFNVATIGISAMLLGLGVEYGIFMLERYLEEKKKTKNAEKAIIIALPSVGSSITGSSLTTIAGFLALATVSFPMLRDLGISLALGIACMILSTILVMPVIFMIEAKVKRWKR